MKRTKVLTAGFCLGFVVCTGQSIRAENGYVIVVHENRAIGAGGGDTSGGTYRSRDGENHKERLAFRRRSAEVKPGASAEFSPGGPFVRTNTGKP